MLVLTKLCKLIPHQRGREITQYVARLAFGLPPRSGFVQQFIQANAASRRGLIQAFGLREGFDRNFREELFVMTEIDITFDFRNDTPRGRDPDAFSPTLRRYHKQLWSKSLPGGAPFALSDSRVASTSITNPKWASFA